LRIGTSDSAQYITREIANAYRRAHPTTTFDFFTSNSTMALRQLAFNQFDFAFVERNPRADELERAGATALELGRDAVFVIVHPSNPLRNLSRTDLRKILTGELNSWSQLGISPPGGRDEIQVLMREEGSGMRAVMEDRVLQGGRVTRTALLMPTNLDMLDYVAVHPGSIGYVAANIWDNNSRTRALGIDNVAATRGNIRAGTFPLLQTVFLIVPQAPDDRIRSFVDFVAGDEGRALLYSRISEIPPK
jgi:phosphate transport system substrate-binding protein